MNAAAGLVPAAPTQDLSAVAALDSAVSSVSTRRSRAGSFGQDRAGSEILVRDCSLLSRQEEGRWLIAGCFAGWSMGTATATGDVRVSLGRPRHTVTVRPWSRATSRRGAS